MKASQITNYGGSDVHQLNEIDQPTAQPGEVLVEVHAAGVNPFDWKLRAGYMKDAIPLEFPATLGGNVAGIVTALGDGVDGFNVGDEVYGMANSVGGAGSFAEYVSVPAEQLAAKPRTLSQTEAAVLPLAGASAYQTIVTELGVSEGQKVLIHGGAGGIGSFAIQLAKHRGAFVAATAGTDDLDFVKSLGADEVIDYTTDDFSKQLEEYDAVLDTVGGDVTTKSLGVLKRGGKIASLLLYGPLEGAAEKGVEAIAVQARPTTENLTAVAALADDGVAGVFVGKTFPLEQTGEALTYLQEAHPKGRVVISVKG